MSAKGNPRFFKILFVVTEDWYFYSHRQPLALAARRAGHEIAIAARVTNHGKLIEEAGIRLIPLGWMKRSSLNVFHELAAFFELYSLFQKTQPDLLHLVGLKPVIYGSLAAKISGVPARVSALGGLGFLFTSNKLLVRLLRGVFLKVFRLIFNDLRSLLILQNQNDLRLITERAGVRLEAVRLVRSAGVDLEQYFPTEFPSGEPVVMLAARMLWDKGLEQFVEAAKMLKAKGIQARFVLVGSPDNENPSSVSIDKLNEWHQAGLIEWWGRRNDMPNVLSQASLVCLPTFYGEGVPKILIEAMACGRPIITTDIPGCRELVQDERNGFLVSPKDAVGLAARVEVLVSNRLLCQSMGVEGRRIAENEFSLQRVTSETIAIYEELQEVCSRL